MGGKGGTKINQPDPVDPYNSANAQMGMNFMTSLSNLYGNRIGQNTPYGSLNYTTNGYTKIDPRTGQVTQLSALENPQSPLSVKDFSKNKTLSKSYKNYQDYQNNFYANAPKYLPNQVQTVKLSPQQQQILDLQNNQDIQSATINNGQMDRVGKTLSQKFDPRLQSFNGGADAVGNFKNLNFKNTPEMINDAGQKAVDFRGNPNMITDAGQKSVNLKNNPKMITDAGQRGVDLKNNPKMITDAGQRGVDFRGNPNLPGVNDFSADRQKVEDAVYSRFDKRFKKEDEAMRARLANQGIVVGSDAWNAEQEAFNQSKNDARTQAILAGGDEQSRIFGLGMNARQQANQEDMDITRYSNDANVTNANFRNNARRQANEEDFELTRFSNDANMNNANFRNNARRQANEEDFELTRFSNDANMNNANFRNNARQQANQEDMDITRYSNDANMNNANFRNNARQQAINERLQDVNVNNDIERNKFSQKQELAAFDNQLRNQQFQEALTRRQLPLNEYASLRSGQQIQNPNFQPFYQMNLAGGDIQGAMQNQFDQQMSKYNAGVAQKNNQKAGTNDLLKTGAMAFASSDPLLKDNIEKVGNIRGFNLYKYTMKTTGKEEIGVMADEIAILRPDCVACDDNGFLMVDYHTLFHQTPFYQAQIQ